MVYRVTSHKTECRSLTVSTQTTVVFPKSKKAFKTSYCWADRDNSPENTQKKKQPNKHESRKIIIIKKTISFSQEKEIHKHRTEDKTRL